MIQSQSQRFGKAIDSKSLIQGSGKVHSFGNGSGGQKESCL